MEMEAGRLKESTHTYSIHNFLWFAYFSFDYKNLITSIFLKDTTDFSVFMLEWKQYILFSLDEFVGY